MEFLERTREGAISSGLNTDQVFKFEQLMVKQMMGKSIPEMKRDQAVIKINKGRIEEHTPEGVRQSFQVEEVPENVRQTLLTSSGTQAFMHNDAAAGYFGASTGVLNPSVYGEVLEGASITALISKLWGIQPFKANELSGDLIYFCKSDPYGDGDPITAGTPVFARTAEGRAGQDMSFEMKKAHFDAQRYICHFPYSVELQRVLAGRLGLDQKIMEHFIEAGIYAEEYWAFYKWYMALTAGTLEGTNFPLYTDGVIAEVDGQPYNYTGYYDISAGAIKAGDSTAYGAATSVTASGADVFDLCQWVIETMLGTAAATGLTAKSYRYQWAPQFVVVPRSIANKLWSDFKDGSLETVWVSKNDVSAYKGETNFLCRINCGNLPLDVWVMPDAIATQLRTANASTFVTTDSPTQTIYPMYFGRYFGMGAVAPATPRLFYTDDGFEVVSRSIGGNNVSQLRRNQTKVHTMYQLRSEILLNASMSFIVKCVA